MASPPPGDTGIDAALQEWRQGDVVLENTPFFLHLADLAYPLTSEARALAETEPAGEGDSLAGAPSQPRAGSSSSPRPATSCARVRAAPLLSPPPLVEVNGADLEDVRRLRRPRFAYLPGVAYLRLVADLDQTMTAEKAVLGPLRRVPGCRDDQERRDFAEALAKLSPVRLPRGA